MRYGVLSWLKGVISQESEMNAGRPMCIIGASIAEGLFLPGEEIIGQRISISGVKLTVIGIFQKLGKFGRSELRQYGGGTL